ncbi:MAG TPA: hypothetical protein VJ783_10125 [Pirellulales bacterium]|nr:hypothetical protein [Pirellulales bacterium]
MPRRQFNLRTLFWWTTVVAILTIAVKIGLPAFEAFVVRLGDTIEQWAD